MEIDEKILTQNYFRAEFKNQDVTSLSSYKIWLEAKTKEGKKVVKCPCCSGYEVYVEPTNHICEMCDREYCQYCLKPCVEDEVEHDHSRGCCSKFCSLVRLMCNQRNAGEATKEDYVKSILVFIFANHFLYAHKYFKFFQENPIIDSPYVSKFFTYVNLFHNLLYCLVYNLMYFQIFFVLFFPAIFLKCYLLFIIENWKYTIYLDVDETPIFELTVRGRGYYMYDYA